MMVNKTNNVYFSGIHICFHKLTLPKLVTNPTSSIINLDITMFVNIRMHSTSSGIMYAKLEAPKYNN